MGRAIKAEEVSIQSKQATNGQFTKAIHIPMDNITKAIVDQTEMNPELVQAVFNALVEIAPAEVRKSDKKAIPFFVSLKLVEAKAGKGMKATIKATTFFGPRHRYRSTKATKATKAMKAMKATKATKAAKAMTITEISDMFERAADVAAEAARVMMAAAHLATSC